MVLMKKFSRIRGKMMLVSAVDTETGQKVDVSSLPQEERQFYDDDVRVPSSAGSGHITPLKDVKNMAEQKAVPLNVVVSDKGQKSVRIGKAFVNLDGKVPLSLTISLEALRTALKNGNVTEQEFKANVSYPDEVLDGKKVVRMAGFSFRRAGSI